MHSLDAVFRPASVAIVGATDRPGSVGRSVLWNLFSGRLDVAIYPVNPHHDSLLGHACYATLDALPGPVDLAVVAVPARSVPDVIERCGAAGVKAAIVLSAGFRETGPQGIALETQILERARHYGMRIVGPNCLGVMSPATGLNATFASVAALSGNVAFISQSGALGTAVLDWSVTQNVGFSHFISVGSMLDVGWADIIDYLGDDPQTQSLVMYMESIGDAPAFLSAARSASFTKPIVVLKAGRTAAAAKAAASHTGALAGKDAVYDAVFARCGVLRVESIDELFSAADALGKQPRPPGNALTIITNAGGAGVLATDALIRGGGTLSSLSAQTKEALDGMLPAHWSKQNPIDVLGDADAERYAHAFEIAASDPATDGLLAIFAPQAVSDAKTVAERLRAAARPPNKTVLATWMGGADIAAGVTLLEQAGIPTFAYPEEAVRAFNALWRYDAGIRRLYETPARAQASPADRDAAAVCIDTVRQEQRTVLTESESKAILLAYGIDAVSAQPAASAEAAVRAAQSTGYPVAVKLHSKVFTHKSDVGGVHLGVTSDNQVRQAFDAIGQRARTAGGPDAFLGVVVEPMAPADGIELILGSSIEPGFGPVLLFGAGGVLVEILHDYALALPPMTTTLARQLMQQTRIFAALGGVRGRRPVDTGALEQLIVRFADLVVEHPRIREIEINPLLASADALVAVDARIILHDPNVTDGDLPQPAIRPYPVQYIGSWTSPSDQRFDIRPVRPDDEPLVAHFAHGLSARSLYLRFGHAQRPDRFGHRELSRACFVDYRREMVLVALPSAAPGEIAGIARLMRRPHGSDAEFALVVNDARQGQGLGTALLQRLIEVGREEGLARIVGYVLAENAAMLDVCRALGFAFGRSGDDPAVVVSLNLAREGIMTEP